MEGNALIVHGGAPTAVINASLYGAVREAGATRRSGACTARWGEAGP